MKEGILIPSLNLSALEVLNFETGPPVANSSRKYDCVIIVEQKGEKRSVSLEEKMKEAASLLKAEGVLVVLTENRLGLKYWAGIAEPESGLLFESICGYPFQNPIGAPTRQELLALFSSLGFSSVEERFVFPDVENPDVVFSNRLYELNPGLSADLATSHKFSAGKVPRLHCFPELLVAENVSQAGLLPEFANAFLFIGSKDSDSSIFQKIVEDGKIGWFLSRQRKHPVETIFSDGGSEEVQVEKRRLSQEVPLQVLEGSHFKVSWASILSEQVRRGRKLRNLLAQYAYFEEWDRFVDEFSAFLKWSFAKWDLKGDLQGAAIDGILMNASVVRSQEYELFDLEWAMDRPVSKSWFILRNVFSLIRDVELYTDHSPFDNFAGIYFQFCKNLRVHPNLERDLDLEAELQSLVSLESSLERHRGWLSEFFSRPLPPLLYPRDPLKESEVRRELFELRKKHALLQERATELEIALMPFHQKIAKKASLLLKKNYPSIHSSIKSWVKGKQHPM